MDRPTSEDIIREGPASARASRVKRPYAAPQLMVYGDIREITQTTTAGPPRNLDGSVDGFIQKRTNGAA